MAYENRTRNVDSRQLAFLLVELLVVLALICAIGGYLFLSIMFPSDKSEMHYHIEKQNAKNWLERKLSHALVRGKRFHFVFSSSGARDKLQIVWEDTGNVEEYRSELLRFKAEGASARFYYSPTFHTMTPSLRISLLRVNGQTERHYGFITISGYCRILLVDI